MPTRLGHVLPSTSRTGSGDIINPTLQTPNGGIPGGLSGHLTAASLRNVPLVLIFTVTVGAALFAFDNTANAQALPGPIAPPGAAAAKAGSSPPTVTPDSQVEAATQAANAEFKRWKQEQAQLAEERLRLEKARLNPLVAAALGRSDIAVINRLIEQIRAASALNGTTKSGYLAQLQSRRVVLLSAGASNALSAQAMASARTQITEARNALDEAGPNPSSAAPLTQVQARYIAARSQRAVQAAEAGRLDEGDAELGMAKGMLSIIAMAEGPATHAAKEQIAIAEAALNRRHVGALIDRATAAEQNRNLRLALYLYGQAQRQGGATAEAINRIDGLRRTPLLEASASFLVPGLGQLTSGRPGTAVLFFASTIGLATAGTLLTLSADNKYEDYLNATNGNGADQRYSAVERRWLGARAAFAGALIMHLWNTYDAYADARQFNRDNFQ